MSESFDPHDDDQLLRSLGEVLDEQEPIPGRLSTYASTLFELGGLDAELAQLTYDSLADPAPVAMRDGSGDRMVVFDVAELSIELEFSAGGVLSGQLLPPIECVVRVQSAAGETVLRSDAAGSFVADLPSVEFRMLLETDHGQVATGWIRSLSDE